MFALAALVVLALIFTFVTAYNNSGSIAATIIFSRALPPRLALGMTAVAEFIGPFLFGVAVAQTLGADTIRPDAITLKVILASLVGAIAWGAVSWHWSIPSSFSHALVGGLIGAVGASAGLDSIRLDGLLVLLASLFIAPVISLFAGYLLTRLVFFLARNATLRINRFFKNAQVVAGIVLALGDGTNTAQKGMAIIILGLIAAGYLRGFAVPLWVTVASAGTIALGTSVGGWRMIKTVGGKFYKIRPVHGFCTQVSSAVVILGASLLGGPVSTSQVVGSALLGVGTAERMNMVRWGVAGNILVAWLLTIPLTALASAGVYFLFDLVL